MRDLAFSALFFIVLMALILIRERRRWRRSQEAQAQVEAALPKLVQTASARYEKRYGRAPSVFDGVQVAESER